MGRLDGITLLKSLIEDERADLEKRCQWRRYAKGDDVFTRNSDNQDMFLITEGVVDIINYSMTGRPVAYVKLGASQYFGELSAIDGEPRSASAVCNQSAAIAELQPHPQSLAGSWLIYPTPPQREFAAHASKTRETVARVFA